VSPFQINRVTPVRDASMGLVATFRCRNDGGQEPGMRPVPARLASKPSHRRRGSIGTDGKLGRCEVPSR
jgi:hypothetical protein